MRKIFLGIPLVLSLSYLEASSLKEAIEDTTISGFAFGRITSNGGKDGAGSRFQFRVKADLTSGEIKGYSLTGGIFFSQGSGTPDLGNNTNDDIQGSRATRFSGSSDVFNISNLYINKNFDFTKTSIKIGQMNIVSPFTDKSLDRGIGGAIKNTDISGLKIVFEGYDTWMTDDFYVAAQAYKSSVGAGIGNNLFLGGVEGDYGLDEENRHKINFKIYDLYAKDLIDLMAFGEVAYKYSMSEHIFFSLLGQIAFAEVSKNPGFKSKSAYLDGYFANKVVQETLPGKPSQELATSRGLWNIQASAEIHKFYAKIGYTRSFSDGYAVMLDNVGAIDTAGKLWNGSQGHGADGFGFLGAGATKGTNISAIYAELDYKLWDFILALDVAYISGQNNYPLLKAGSMNANRNYRGVVPAYINNKTMDASFVELTPTLTYKVTKKLSAQIYFASILGDINLNRTRFQVTYNF